MANIKKLRETMAAVREAAKIGLWDQRDFFTPNECGTTMCFAGWRCHLDGYRSVNPESGSERVFHPTSPIVIEPAFYIAKKSLELTDGEADFLFIFTASIDDIDKMESAVDSVINGTYNEWDEWKK